jgi:Arc/MetJ-type ribon-helix-helix transcriptional regulator
MKDTMVSIRIPGSLLEELKAIAQTEHYMDVSEEIRSIVRDRWLQAKQPELEELKKLKEDIKRGLETKKERLVRIELIRELEKIKESVKKNE